ncbi:MAG: ATP-dependent dethiobiotin synthetase BioD [Gloeomargaritaceae cyanobacterium C42_A2020_066]|nr:ATP-dependent dethiobiotin synthetase BioD [Gloeomargaritaceae cyanobacterium C42_A2020_066]
MGLSPPPLFLPKKALLVAATDTECGKTVATLALAAYWQTQRPAATLGVMKLVQAGPGDRETYRQVLRLNQTDREWNPLYFEAPLAPPLAAALEGRVPDLALAWQSFQGLCARCDWILVEAAGGLGTPIDWAWTFADLAHHWRLPVVLVVPVQLGCIAQTVANVALARQYDLNLRGILLNCRHPRTAAEIDQWAPHALIQSLTQAPILGLLPYLEYPLDPSALAAAAAGLDWELLLP